MKARNLVLVALFAALTAIGAFIRIPAPIAPITLQTLFCIMAGMMIGPWLGSISQVAYIVIGLVGLPVFASGGGIGYIFQPSFGYLLGLIPGAFVSGLIVERIKKLTFLRVLLGSFAGLLAVYSIGLPYLYVIKNIYLNKGVAVSDLIYGGLILFIPGDILKCLLTSILVVKIKPILSRMNPRKK